MKLKYRLGILKRAAEKEGSAKPRKTNSIKRAAMEKPDYTGKMKSIHGMLTAEFRDGHDSVMS